MSKYFLVEVSVTAPARLHLGFLDLHGGLGRHFGSLGVAVSDVETRVVASKRDPHEKNADSAEQARAAHAAAQICRHFGLCEQPAVSLEKIIPPHAGLGSGTQLALAVGRALLTYFGRDDVQTPKIAEITGRGARSGIGIGVFDSGGFVVDLGRGAETLVPPQLTRMAFPEDWPILLMRDLSSVGISGSAEKSAFKNLAPMSETLVSSLCRHTLMGVLPSIAERDFERFAGSLEIIQAAIGDYFAPCQGGQRFTSPVIGELADVIKKRHPEIVVGQSSWGPTGFAFCPHADVAADIESAFCTGELIADIPAQVRLSIHKARNQGAEIIARDGARKVAG